MSILLPVERRMGKPKWEVMLAPALVVLAPLLAFALFLLASGVNPITLYGTMLKSTFGDWYGFGEVVIKATPFILTALAASLPAKAGMINVGGEGQLAIGALAVTAVGVYLLPSVPGWIGVPILVLVGALGGALWASVAAIGKVKGKMNETITTLLLNYIAYFTIGFFVHSLLKDPASFNWPFSKELAGQLRLLTFSSASRVHVGIGIALILAAIVWFLITQTRLGFRIRVVGGNVLAAKRAGLKDTKIQFWVLIAAGAIAGIAGMIEITGIEGRLRPTTGMNYGYLGFLASWMAWNHPLWLIATSFIIGMISVAGNSLEMNSGLPASSVQILMALVLFAILAVGRRKQA
ncbi:ABC transporter permease [Paenibacillus roseipurpureus]|uniref:ABC transporter permease n=1 Tax=Paenibacillus roseopurpureus TaxID=2918901 RepID=A0AA96LI71_9BACL|nr:ABC transporter permease [Paenibacillus sp. MBLB1832]WNR42167.1 ABC transporter permease [Paenibacillus sp. MBLB1832]